jgi:type I restriction enzyme S subunit
VKELPTGWAWATIGQVADTRLGKMLSAKARSGNGGRPYLRNKNVQWGQIEVDDLLRMDFSDQEFEEFRLREGDLLVCEGGEVGRAAIWRGGIECAFQKALHRVRPWPGVMPEYLLYLLMHYANTRVFDRYVTGSTIAHLPQEDLRELPVPVPPVAEQRRIVAAIEELFSRLEAAIASLEALKSRLARLREAIIESELPADARLRPLVELALPNGVTDGPFGSNLKTEHYTVDGPRVIRLQNVGEGFFIDARAHISLTHFEHLRRHEVRGSDLVVAALGHRLPRSCVIPPGLGPAIVKADCIRVRVRHDVDVRYVNFVLNSRRLHRHAESIIHGVGRPRLNLREVKALPIPVVALSRQKEIADRIESNFARISVMEGAADGGLVAAGTLRKAIASRAFRGELVSQDLHDEPADVLLERITPERAASTRPRRRRRGKTSA